MVNIAGTYSFVSQNNFDAYLKAIGIGTIKAAIINKTSPDVTIEVTGDHFKVVTATTMKTITVEFDLGKEYEADPGTDKLKKYVSTLDGDTLTTKEVEDPSSYATRKFTNDGFVMTMVSGGVTATRTFKRK